MLKLLAICFVLSVFSNKPVKLSNANFQIIHAITSKQNHNVKVIELIKDRIKHRNFFYGLEISPKSDFILDYNEFGAMRTKPLFTSITWHVDETFETDVSLRHDVAPYRMFEVINENHPAMLHLSCNKLNEWILDKILLHNVTNLFVIRGDSFHSTQPYQRAKHLVTAIRRKTGFNTSIGVAAYPEKHPESESFESDLLHLKEKVEAGADFIITQICFNATTIINFIEEARLLNISVPIIPGIFIPRSYQQLEVVTQRLSIKVPDEMLSRVDAFKSDDSKGFGPIMNHMMVELIDKLRHYSEHSSNFIIPGVQLFTFNHLENVLQVIVGANL